VGKVAANLRAELEAELERTCGELLKILTARK